MGGVLEKYWYLLVLSRPFQNNGISIGFYHTFGVLEIRQKRPNHCGFGSGNGVILGCHGNFGFSRGAIVSVCLFVYRYRVLLRSL